MLEPQTGNGLKALEGEPTITLRRYCRRLCPNPADAEDLAQDSLLCACGSLHRYEGRASLTRWLCAIALNRWRSLSRARHLDCLPLDPALDALPDPAAPVPGAERLILEEALTMLPRAQREVVHRVHRCGLSYAEAAAEMGIPESRVRSRLHNGVVRLRALLAEDNDPPPVRAPALGRAERETRPALIDAAASRPAPPAGPVETTAQPGATTMHSDDRPTAGELRALRAVADHGTLGAAAEALQVSVHTIDAQLDQLRQKSGRPKLPQLVAWAAENGWLFPDANDRG